MARPGPKPPPAQQQQEEEETLAFKVAKRTELHGALKAMLPLQLP